MKNQSKRKAVITGLAVSASLSAPITNVNASQAGFSDVPENHFASSMINEFVTKGILLGYPDGTFKPNMQVTRAEFIKIVNKAMNLTKKGTVNFSDIKEDAWYYPEIEIAMGNGYLNGYEDGTFRPNEKISREEMAKILGTILNVEGDGITSFIDDELIAPWAEKYVDGLVDEGIINGYPDGSFNPKGSATRGESVKTIHISSNMNDTTIPPGTGGTTTDGTITPNPDITTDSTINPDTTTGDTTRIARINNVSTDVEIKRGNLLTNLPLITNVKISSDITTAEKSATVTVDPNVDLNNNVVIKINTLPTEYINGIVLNGKSLSLTDSQKVASELTITLTPSQLQDLGLGAVDREFDIDLYVNDYKPSILEKVRLFFVRLFDMFR